MNRVNFNRAAGTTVQTAYWNEHTVVRSNQYMQAGSFQTSAEILTPSDNADDTGRLSTIRKILVSQAPVATVTVSPSSATIRPRTGP